MNVINVCTYNVMLPVSAPIRFNGQTERCDRIPKRLEEFCQKHFHLDVIVFTEVIDQNCRNRLLTNMKKYGWRHSSEVLYKKYPIRKLKLVSGGVVVVSKHKIIYQKIHVFEKYCQGYDCFSCKGIVYCRIIKNNNVFNIFGVHLQAWDTPYASKIRISQACQCRQFIDSLNIPFHEPVIIMGDFNIDFYTRNHNIVDICKTMSIEILEKCDNSFEFSSDPNTNKLVGNDDASMYKTTSYPNGCYEQYMNTMSCPCCPQELLDYICVCNHHIKPDVYKLFVYKMKTKKKFKMKVNISTERYINDLSDHYPLIAQLRYKNNTSTYKNLKIDSSMSKRTDFLFLSDFIIIYFLICVILLLYH